MARVLVACEESQAVTLAFRGKGIEAFSCDIVPCSGGHPEWHLQMNAAKALDQHWDLVIAHPPCTYMSKAGARWMYPKAGILSHERLLKAYEARAFFELFYDYECPYICIENPRPLRAVKLPPPTQVIQPYEYGHPYNKATLLWLKGLPPLEPTELVKEHTPWMPSNTGAFSRGGGGSRGVAHDAVTASKTFSGVAAAMADQWGAIITDA